MADGKGASAMLKLAERLDWVATSLSEFRQEAKERFDRMDERLQEHGERLARLEADVTTLKTDVAALKQGRNGGEWVRYVWNFVSVLVGALLALVGVRIQGSG